MTQPTGTAQGRCETTQTERYVNAACTCDTYPENLGPCLRFEEGERSGFCVYCDHGVGCHQQLLQAGIIP
jgi:hypothetical protein